jgi:dipeptidyl aminopeptidase/acylaminoacyl peptidase
MTFSRLLAGSFLFASTAFAQTTQPAGDFLEPPAAMSAPGVPPIPMSLVDRVRDYTEFRGSSPMSWHPSQRQMLVRTRFGNVSQAHLVDGPLRDRHQLTFFREGIRSASFPRWNDSYLLISADVGGSEFTQLYRLDLTSRDVTLLTDGKSRNSGGAFSNVGDQIAFTSTKRNGRDNDIYLMDPKDPSTTKLLAQVEGGGWGVSDWSPDDKQLLVGRYVSVTQSERYLLDVASGKMTKIAPRDDARISYDGGAFLPDGKILLTSDRDSEFARPVILDPVAGTETPFPIAYNGDVEGISLSTDGKRVVLSVNEAGLTKLYHYGLDPFTTLELPELPKGQITLGGFRKDSSELVLTVNSSRGPGEVYSLDVETGGVQQWTRAEGPLATESFPAEELVKWPSFDGLSITGWLYRPDAKKFPGKRPVIISIHGGPEGQSRPGFQGRNNYYLNELGVAVLYPNVRGSTGFGKTFVELDNGMKREDSVKDIGALLDWIAKDPSLDASRVMVTGGSYGGYMTLAVATLYPDRIRCAASSVGISNFVTFLESTQAYRRDLRRVEYGDERDPAMRSFLQSISPLNRADKITVPMMIIQGANDPRVPVGESEQIVKSLQARGHAVWYLLAADEGHGFAKKDNTDFQFYATVLFVKKYLVGE